MFTEILTAAALRKNDLIVVHDIIWSVIEVSYVLVNTVTIKAKRTSNIYGIQYYHDVEFSLYFSHPLTRIVPMV